MSGNFYEVFENRRKRAQLTPQEELDFFASCLEIRMFNVGEGELVLLVFPNDRAWLVDGGSSTGTTINGKLATALADYLKKRELLLEAIVLSHPHTDHGLALQPLLKERRQLASKVTYYHSADAYYDDGKAWLHQLRAEIDSLNPGVPAEVVLIAEHRPRDVAVPGGTAHFFAGKPISKGYTSIFLNFHFGDARLLFTGDVTCGYEIRLLKTLGEEAFRADVLKVTHHGASSGTANRLVCAVKPGITIASTAEEDGHRLEEDVLERLGGRPGRRKVLETFVDGDIIIKTNGLTRNGGVLYHVYRKRPGQFAKKLDAKISLLRDVVRGSTKHTNCEKGC